MLLLLVELAFALICDDVSNVSLDPTPALGDPHFLARDQLCDAHTKIVIEY